MTLAVPAEILAILKEDQSFSQMNEKTIRALASCAVIGKYKHNQYLWKYGDQGDHCTLVTSGLIEVTRPTGDEEDTCMGIFGKGDVIGLSAFLHKINFPGSAKALDDSKTIKFYLSALNDIPDNKIILQDLSSWMRERILAHEHILREKIDIITAGTIENRLRELFKHLLRRFGNIKSGFKYEIKIKLTKSKAAKIMGIRNETAIRLINDWQKRNLIKWEEDKIIIHNLEMIDRLIMQKRSK